MNNKDIIEDLKFRGLINQSTDLDELEKRLENLLCYTLGLILPQIVFM